VSRGRGKPILVLLPGALLSGGCGSHPPASNPVIPLAVAEAKCTQSLREATPGEPPPPTADWRVRLSSDTLLLLDAEVLLSSPDGSEASFIVNCDTRPRGDDLRAALVFLGR